MRFQRKVCTLLTDPQRLLHLLYVSLKPSFFLSCLTFIYVLLSLSVMSFLVLMQAQMELPQVTMSNSWRSRMAD